MSSNINKSAVIVTLWITMAVLAFFGLTIGSSRMGGELSWYFVLPLLLAFVGTFAVWWTDVLATRMLSSPRSGADSEKAKRQGADKLALLMDLLDEDERAAFKARLMDEVLAEAGSGSDGELPYDAESLEALLGDQESARSLRE